MKPVFIGGCHRSGTTLLGALLGAHPSCLTTPESQFKTDALSGVGLPANNTELQGVLKSVLKARSFARWGVNGTMLERADGEEWRDYADFLRQLVKGYGPQAGRSSFELWVDHTPKNVRHLTTLFSLFPNARAIHIVRDGRGVAASVLPLDWGPNTIIAAAHWWIHHIAFGLAAETFYGENRVLRVRYEDLVTKPKAELERICEWLDIEYVGEMSRGGGFKFAAGFFRYHPLIHEEPDASRATAWKNALSAREIRTFESRACDLLSFLGYQELYRDARTAAPERFRTMLLEPLLMAANACRFRYWRLQKERKLARSAVSEKRDA